MVTPLLLCCTCSLMLMIMGRLLLSCWQCVRISVQHLLLVCWTVEFNMAHSLLLNVSQLGLVLIYVACTDRCGGSHRLCKPVFLSDLGRQGKEQGTLAADVSTFPPAA